MYGAYCYCYYFWDLSSCTSLVPSPGLTITQTSEHPLAAYKRVLQAYVNDRGEVDFPTLQKNSADLDRYIVFVAQHKASAISDPNARLAHYINSYNALSMYNVLKSGIPKTHAGIAKINFFYLRKHLIGGEELSLYDYENDIIRKLNEPRVHFALNCSALSCPLLPRTPFTGPGLGGRTRPRDAQVFFGTPQLAHRPQQQGRLRQRTARFLHGRFFDSHNPDADCLYKPIRT